MTAAHERLYLRTLHQLVAAGVPFGLLGTFALRQQCSTLPRRLVADCDLLLPPDPAALNVLTNLLQASGWRVTLWEQPVEMPLRTADLTGKYYLRARQVGAVLDCAYENDFLSWPAFWASCHWHQGLPLLMPAAILRQKAQVGRPADLAVLRWWQRVGGFRNDQSTTNDWPPNMTVLQSNGETTSPTKRRPKHDAANGYE